MFTNIRALRPLLQAVGGPSSLAPKGRGKGEGVPASAISLRRSSPLTMHRSTRPPDEPLRCILSPPGRGSFGRIAANAGVLRVRAEHARVRSAFAQAAAEGAEPRVIGHRNNHKRGAVGQFFVAGRRRRFTRRTPGDVRHGCTYAQGFDPFRFGTPPKWLRTPGYSRNSWRPVAKRLARDLPRPRWAIAREGLRRSPAFRRFGLLGSLDPPRPWPASYASCAQPLSPDARRAGA
jgi:hypothetical protein